MSVFLFTLLGNLPSYNHFFSLENQRAALSDISRLFDLGTKKVSFFSFFCFFVSCQIISQMGQGGDWLEEDKDVVFLQDYSWNLG